MCARVLLEGFHFGLEGSKQEHDNLLAAPPYLDSSPDTVLEVGTGLWCWRRSAIHGKPWSSRTRSFLKTGRPDADRLMVVAGAFCLCFCFLWFSGKSQT